MTTLHATVLYAGLLGLLLVVLSYNVMKSWVQSIGAAGVNDPDLRRAEALVSSFSDYVPLTLFLMALAELRGAPIWSLHILGVLLVLARVMHAFGSNRGAMADGLRFLGAQITYLVLTAVSFICLYVYAAPQVIF